MNSHILHKPIKKLGQNFLINTQIIKKIIDSINYLNDDIGIIEIGPGKGALTKYLVDKCKKLILIEIDNNLSDFLKNNFQDYKNVEIINKDILKTDFDKLVEKLKECKKIIIVSNTPYYISSQILFLLFQNYLKIDEAILMMQKEVALKLFANPNDKKYSSITVVRNYHADIEKITDVKNTAFFPKPKVDSIVFKLIFKKNNFSINDLEFHKFVRICFQFKRKLLVNNLKNNDLYSQDIISKLLNFFNLDKNIRAEQLCPKFFLKFFIFLKNCNLDSKLLLSNAKCTLALDIKKTKDRLHDLEGIYAPYFDMHDEILINFNCKQTNILVFNYLENILDNNILHLVSILKVKKIFNENIEVIIWKNISPCTGLSGGSSNLYFVAKEIFLYKKLDINNYLEILYNISSDSIFFNTNKLAYVSNYGKNIQEILINKDLNFKVIYLPHIRFLTKEMYDNFDKYNFLNYKKISILLLINYLKTNDIKKFNDNTFNNFLPVALENGIFLCEYKKLVKLYGRKYKIILSGSGSSLILLPL